MNFSIFFLLMFFFPNISLSRVKDITCGKQQKAAAISRLQVHIEFLKNLRAASMMNSFEILPGENSAMDFLPQVLPSAGAGGPQRESFLQMLAFSFHQSLLQWCRQRMFAVKKYHALFETWDLFKSHPSCDPFSDIFFVRAYALLLFGMYHQLQSVYIEEKAVTAEKLCDLYVRVSQLPLEQLLTTLDACFYYYNHLLPIEFAEGDLDFPNWLKEYWWVPCTVSVAIGLMIYGRRS